MTGENAALHRQVETATQQMADMAAAGLNTSSANMNTSGVRDNLDVSREEGCSQELVAVIKYLRQEKQILTSRLEVVGAEAARTASQLQHQQRLTEDAEAALGRPCGNPGGHGCLNKPLDQAVSWSFSSLFFSFCWRYFSLFS